MGKRRVRKESFTEERVDVEENPRREKIHLPKAAQRERERGIEREEEECCRFKQLKT